MRGLTRYDGAPTDLLRGATRRSFERLVDLALEQSVDFVVIAGDLYDGDRDDFNTAIFLQRQLLRLREGGIPVVIAYGNHDAANEITKRLRFPDGVDVLAWDKPGTVLLDGLGVAIHGQSYPTKAVLEDLSLGYPPPVSDFFNIGVLHTSLDGRPGHDRYAPCTVAALARHGYSYWALGHVHKREVIVEDGVHIVFPGNLQGRDVGETGPKGASVVEFDLDGIVSVSQVDLAPVVWARLEVDVRTASSVDDALGRIVEEIMATQAASNAEMNAVRVTLRANRALAAAWLREPERYEAQLQADATGAGESLWLERIVLQSESSNELPVSGEALAAVLSELALLRTNPDKRANAQGLLAGLRNRFGPERREAVALGAKGLDEDSFNEVLDDVAALLAGELGSGV
jgi:DNA repair exonuclease SbcCD nuclease subunit